MANPAHSKHFYRILHPRQTHTSPSPSFLSHLKAFLPSHIAKSRTPRPSKANVYSSPSPDHLIKSPLTLAQRTGSQTSLPFSRHHGHPPSDQRVSTLSGQPETHRHSPEGFQERTPEQLSRFAAPIPLTNSNRTSTRMKLAYEGYTALVPGIEEDGRLEEVGIRLVVVGECELSS